MSAPLHDTVRVYWMTKSPCPFGCAYCIERAIGTQDLARSISTVDALQALRNMSGPQGGRELIITGGDPAERQDLSHLCEAARPLFQRVSLYTCGMAGTNQLLAVAAHGLVDELRVSLDSFSPPVNDVCRSAGREVVQFLAHVAAKRAASLRLSVSCVLGTWNLSSVMHLVRSCLDLGVDRLAVSPVYSNYHDDVAVRRDRGLCQQHLDTLRDVWNAALREVRGRMEITPWESIEFSIAWLSGDRGIAHSCYCGALARTVWLGPLGDIVPCYNLRDCVLGSALQGPLTDQRLSEMRAQFDDFGPYPFCVRESCLPFYRGLLFDHLEHGVFTEQIEANRYLASREAEAKPYRALRGAASTARIVHSDRSPDALQRTWPPRSAPH